MTPALKAIDATDLARAIATVIAERYDRTSEGLQGYYGVPQPPHPIRDGDLRSLLLDGTDDLIAICEEALKRLGEAR
jgi:hypothetical protein